MKRALWFSRVAALGACGLSATAIAIMGCGSGVVARVGSSEISDAELGHWLSANSKVARQGAGSEGARREVAGLLVLAQWITGEARQLGVAVSAGEVSSELGLLRFDQRESALSETLPRDPVMRKLLLSPNLDVPDQRWLMRLNLLAAKIEGVRLQQAEREIPAQQVAAFYSQHRRRFLLPERRSLEVIGSHQKAVVVRAKHEIEHGKPFLELARRVSADGEAPEGLQELVRGKDEEQFERPVFAAKPHVLVGPKKYLLYFIFEVLKSTPAHQQSLVEAEGAIRRELASGQPLRRLTAASEASWAARTSCSPAYHTQRCAAKR
jgi:hypothetical protein